MLTVLGWIGIGLLMVLSHGAAVYLGTVLEEERPGANQVAERAAQAAAHRVEKQAGELMGEMRDELDELLDEIRGED